MVLVPTLAFLMSTVSSTYSEQPDAKDREIASKSFPALKLVRIPAKGKQFIMGAPKGTPGQRFDENEHQVTLTADFYLAVVPVTRGQFAAFVKDTGYVTDPEKVNRTTLAWRLASGLRQACSEEGAALVRYQSVREDRRTFQRQAVDPP
jgi:formylglycine-generating enzyme required for sulfatase activity